MIQICNCHFQTHCSYKIYLDDKPTKTEEVKASINADYKHERKVNFKSVTDQVSHLYLDLFLLSSCTPLSISLSPLYLSLFLLLSLILLLCLSISNFVSLVHLIPNQFLSFSSHSLLVSLFLSIIQDP